MSPDHSKSSSKPATPLSANFADVVVKQTPRSRRFKIVIGLIILFAAIVVITIITDLLTTGKAMER